MENRLKQLRNEKKLTLKQLGNNLEMRDNTLSQYETGKREPKLKTWQKLADFFGVPVSYIQGYGESMDSISENIIFLLSSYWFKGYTEDAITGDRAETLNTAIIDFCRLKAINFDELLYPELDGTEIYSDSRAEKIFKNKFWFLFKNDFLIKLYEKEPYSFLSYDLIADEISKEINRIIYPLKEEEKMQHENERKKELGISIKDVDIAFTKKEINFDHALELGSKRELVHAINALIDFLENLKEKINNN